MERLKKKCMELYGKYKYVALIVLVGVLFMLLPVSQDAKESAAQKVTPQIAEENTQDKIQSILSYIQGAGKVQVLLTISQGQETVYQENVDLQFNENNHSERTDTVVHTDAERNQYGLISKTIPEQYLGAVVVCQGADDPYVKLAIVDAVSKATGLGADKISVLKMK